jgi:eukaryotic-like serine/threonine-protein kinase
MACPDIEQLERLAAGETADDTIASHVASCDECAELLHDLEQNLKLLSPLRARFDASPRDEFDDAPPQQIGPYRILRKLGEGGMGAVYEAQQENPRRTVALKIIRSNLVSRVMLARFRREAQMLGRLRHPGIAQVYEAGAHATPHGPIPYLVMELVRGAPLLKYAQHGNLEPAARLELLARVCDAVQHAHSRGVIHRDLKPDNILVEEEPHTSVTAVRGDKTFIAGAQPKILDFGVARAVADENADAATLRTDAGQILGTIAYMSPEQAGGATEEIDTRSDVYALGVIGYELLCGRLPHSVNRANLAESVRTIVQDEPALLSSVNPSLRGDVTTIISKALSKEKARRYQSAAEMAADLRRFLADEPISAHPPSAMYQLGKFARRNKGLVAGVAAAFVILVFGVIGTGIGMLRAQHARDQAEDARIAADKSAAEARREADKQAAVSMFMREMLSAANPRELTAADRAKGRDITVVEAMDAAARRVDAGALKDQPEIELVVRIALAVTYTELGKFDRADHHISAGLEKASTTYGRRSGAVLDFLNSLSILRNEEGRFAESDAAAREMMETSRAVHGENHLTYAQALTAVATNLESQGKLAEAEPLMRQALEIRRAAPGDNDRIIATSLSNLAVLVDQLGRAQEAESLFREALAIYARVLGENHPDTASVMINLGFVLRTQNKLPEALTMHRRVLEIRRQLLGPEHPTVAATLSALGGSLFADGQLDEARSILVEAISLQRKILGAEHPSLANSVQNLAHVERQAGNFDSAVSLYREAMDIRRKTMGEKHPAVIAGFGHLATLLNDMGRFEEALNAAQEGVAAATARYGVNHSETWAHRVGVATMLISLKRYEEAEKELQAAWPVMQPKVASGERRAVLCTRQLVRLYSDWGKPEEAAKFAAFLPTTRPAR